MAMAHNNISINNTCDFNQVVFPVPTLWYEILQQSRRVGVVFKVGKIKEKNVSLKPF